MVKNMFKNESTYKNFLESGNEKEFDRLFDLSIHNIKHLQNQEYFMYIDGKAQRGDSLLIEHSPIDSNIILGKFQKGSRQHAKAAIDAAKNAFKTWGAIDYKKRAEIFFRFADLLSQKKFDIAAILSMENGKSRYESIGEVDEAIDFSRYYSNELILNKGYKRKTHIDSSNNAGILGFQGAPGQEENVSIELKPIGVFGIIAPFNFPISISCGMSIGALITGNTVVFKPSSTDNMTMLTGFKIYELLTQAGIPAGVFNFITGPGSEIGNEMIENKDVCGIAFTGSKNTGTGMIKRSIELGINRRFIIEMGGKNPAIVSKYADIDNAVDGISSAAFGYCGQKCSALSRVYIHSSIKEQFISKLIDKVRTFGIGNPLDKKNYVGPLIGKIAYERYLNSITKIKESGTLLYGGNNINVGLNGFYVEPCIAQLKQDNELVHQELFVPILSVIEYTDFDNAIKMANDIDYGLTAGLYSKKKQEIEQFKEQIKSGVIYINRRSSATTGAIVGLHAFVGWKWSGFTGKGSGSKYYLEQFTNEQSIAIAK